MAAFRKWRDDLLAAFGLPCLYACGEIELQEPPAGHPERLRPDRPLTAYETWLTGQLATESGNGTGHAKGALG
ncbi:DUF6059 family protein [Streptomyces sp. NPDC101776]|uniref:DUF6059 family protein n=1 Tax=Streptomyces sp. NPDC101776 TaxID=3366146 RepID=UPI003821C869